METPREPTNEDFLENFILLLSTHKRFLRYTFEISVTNPHGYTEQRDVTLVEMLELINEGCSISTPAIDQLLKTIEIEETDNT